MMGRQLLYMKHGSKESGPSLLGLQEEATGALYIRALGWASSQAEYGSKKGDARS
jgi:hypothetical protein